MSPTRMGRNKVREINAGNQSCSTRSTSAVYLISTSHAPRTDTCDTGSDLKAVCH